MTAAKERVLNIEEYQQEAAGGRFDVSYRRVIGSLNLFHQAHQQHLRLLSCPVIRQMLLRLGSHAIIG